MSRPPPPSWLYGAAVPGQNSAAGGFYPPGYFPPNPNQQYPWNIHPSQLLPYLPQPLSQNPRAVQPQTTFPINPGFTASAAPPATLAAVGRAAARAQAEIAASGESVSAWKVSQAVIVALKVDSWSSLGFQPQDVPAIHRLLLIEGKVNAFIHCFVCSRKIASMHELEISICQNEGVRQFEELGLGPFLQQPLVKEYFTFSDSKEVFKITSQDIVLSLQEFMNKFKKNSSAERFIRFLAEQKSVSEDTLGVRIQDLRFYISRIQEVRRAECNVFREKMDGSLVGSDKNEVLEKKFGSQPRNIASEKQILDKRFNYISSCVKTFSSECKELDGKHVYFNVSDDCDECNESKEDDISGTYKCDGKDKTSHNNYQSLSSVKGCGQLVSSCPYPSKTEEMVRLGLKPVENYKTLPATAPTSGTQPTAFRRKRKKESKDNKICKYIKKEEATELKIYDQTSDLTLHNGDVEKFVATWKMACREYPVSEVLDSMLSFYVEKVHKREKLRKYSSSYPFIGMLNVAIASIKRGMLESIYDTFQALNTKEIIGADSVGCGEMIEVMPMVEVGDPIIDTYCGSSVTVDDITKKIADYFNNDLLTSKEINLSPEKKQLHALKKFYDCEVWLLAQFNVQEFSSLGHGNFFEFLENHNNMLPHGMRAFLSTELFGASSVEVCLIQYQLSVMLSQTKGNLMDKVGTSCFDIVSLLTKQFPTASFCLIGVDPQKHIEELINMHKESVNSSCVLFSTCLLGNQSNQNSLKHIENCSLNMEGMETKVAQPHSSRRTSKDAIECLLNAPMLEDLLSWSHWELIYAPSLGPLSDFLFKKVNYKNLLCIATVDGKFIRVDHTASVDEFLEAFVQCSSFNIALNFLSLICLYRGINNTPLALLKCYAQKAVSVIVQNCTDLVEINVHGLNFIPGHNVRNIDGVKECNGNTYGRSFSPGLCIVNDSIATVSRTMLECLKYLPSEFRSFAAEIFLAGLRSTTKDAPVVILNQCSQTNERVMLHDIGISLGVTEWIADQQLFISSSAHDSLVHVSKFSTSENQNITPGKITGDLVGGDCQFSSGVICATSKGDVGEMQAICDSTREVIRISEEQTLLDATAVVESIRQEEFGLISNSNKIEDSLLKKQHARLGRALHCLSQELYSQDSHFILELVQNADDNIYPNDVEPELVFILQESGIVVLNNELGFSSENIRALCDVGNSTKKGSCGGYIGKKGIGFKSVFRVTDAPEIHSNGFHVKFDITEGQIGFVLPTVIPPCDATTFKQYLCVEDYQVNDIAWNTCILLPFRSEGKRTGVSSIISMFSDIHPSLLLFLHRLRCIKFRNLISDRLIVMRKETLHNGIVKVSHGEEIMSWLVISKKLRSSVIRTDVDETDISMAFTLQESDCGEYQPILRNQPVFSFLPLRNYGLKFILQGDFVLPSSREEVDGSSAWNQWLLSEFPALFISAKQSFCDLPCFLKNPGKAVTIFMSFVPLVGEVHGFFSQLPQMIISLLRVSTCLLQDSGDMTWVLPCRVLRGWNEQVRLLLSDHLLQRHLRLVYLHKDVKLSDILAANIGVRDYGPKVLVEVIDSVCHSLADLKSLGIDWLSAWLFAVSSSLSMNLSKHASLNDALELDIINDLRNIPFIPLADGSYGCVADAPIWLPCDIQNIGPKSEYHAEDFPCLYNKLRIVNPHLFSVATKNIYSTEVIKADAVMKMLIKIGVQQLSAHTVITSHILVALSEKHTAEDQSLMIEYLSFIMLHLQTDCVTCHSEKPEIMAELRRLPILLTNHGFKCPSKRPIHFGREYGNPVDVVVLLDAVDIKWVEVDSSYLKHPSTLPLVSGLMKWRSFFVDLGVTDFVQVRCTNKNVEDFFSEDTVNRGIFNSATSYVMDWESHELLNLLSIISSKKFRTKCILLLEVFDKIWDDNYSAQTKSFIISKIDGAKKPVVSSFMKSIYKFSWVASAMDMDLHQPTSLFYGCEQVHAVLGPIGPYAVPKVNSKVLVNDFRFKMEVSIDDAVKIVQFWTKSKTPFAASIAQMSNFYTLISSAINISSLKIMKELIPSSFIFVPFFESSQSRSVSGMFLSPKEVHWQDPTGCVDRMKEAMLLGGSLHKGTNILCRSLETVYPCLHDFFVNICGVPVTPSFCSYFQILQQLSGYALPSQASHEVFRVMVRWADDLKSGLVSPDQLSELKEKIAKVDNTVLPTEQDKWVSLHPSFGLICWSDDDELKKQFKHSEGVDFIQFGKLSVEENDILSSDVANLFRTIGVPALSEVVSREAIFYGAEDNGDKVSLVNWIVPYAQRYIRKLHLDTYLKLKQMGSERINQLQVVVVNKLFYKYILQGHDCALKQRFECNCLLQGNILYTCQSADSHSMFLELSRFFFNGSPQLHLANFLHMAATMALSGSTVEQIEFFIVNSQKIPELPDDETPWSIQYMCEVDEPQIPVLPRDLENGISKCPHRKPGTSSQWPPTDWKSAPDFEHFRNRNLQRKPSVPSPYDSLQAGSSNVVGKNAIVSVEEPLSVEEPVSVEITGKWTLEEFSMPEDETTLLTSQIDSASDPASYFEEHDGKSGPRIRMPNPARFFEREVLNRKNSDKISAQCVRTGRLGEMLAYQYFTEKFSSADVRWVNKDAETGLPYDLVVAENETTQYIEVKATISAAKDWFEITTREWKFASEMEDSYSIAHVAILGPDKANVTIMKNPYKLCLQRVLSLAVVMPSR